MQNHLDDDDDNNLLEKSERATITKKNFCPCPIFCFTRILTYTTSRLGSILN